MPFWLSGAGPSLDAAMLRQTEIAGTACAPLGVPHAGMAVNEALP